MAELPEVGQHCSLPTCQQLDFLPIVCVGCRLVFCKLHSSFDSHECPKRPNVEVKEIVQKQSSSSDTCGLLGCDSPGNVLKPLVECRTCHRNFCFEHRNELDHKCSAKLAADGGHVMEKTREIVKNILSKENIDSKKLDKKVSAKNAKMSAKIQLMKLKQNADGNKSIPPNERVYFRVHFPSKKSESVNSKNVFVSSKISSGKVVDALAELCQIENPNNSSMVTKKLRIFGLEGDIWSSNLSDILETMIKEEMAFNGESIILEYSENSEKLSEEILVRYKNVK